MERKDKVEGEGSYSGTQDYNERTRKFMEQGKVDEAARRAAARAGQAGDAEGRAHRQAARQALVRRPVFLA